MNIKKVRTYISNIVSPGDDQPLNDCVEMVLVALKIMKRATRLDKKFTQNYVPA